MPLQHVIFYTAATFALVLWGWHHFSVRWIYEPDAIALGNIREGPGREAERPAGAPAAESRKRGRATSVAYSYATGAYWSEASSSCSPTRGRGDGRRLLHRRQRRRLLILAALLALAVTFNRHIAENKSAFIGMTALIGLFIVGSIVVDGFFSAINMKSMLVFAAFLGLAWPGPDPGGAARRPGPLDPFIIGSANIGLMYLFGFEGLPNWIAVIFILILGTLIGMVTGFLSFRLQARR